MKRCHWEIEKHMIHIPAGEIVLRDDRTGDRWRVNVKPFLLSRYLVTQSLYGGVTDRWPTATRGMDHPVESVSWLDAAHFCNELSRMVGQPPYYEFTHDRQNATEIEGSTGYRLPREAEWEFACRAGTPGVRYGELNDIAWYRGNSASGPNPVGGKQPNAWGLYDMLGNVWEWCTDVYDPAVYGTYRIFRGGGWADEARGCLATNRRRSHPAFAIDDLGFRLARST